MRASDITKSINGIDEAISSIQNMDSMSDVIEQLKGPRNLLVQRLEPLMQELDLSGKDMQRRIKLSRDEKRWMWFENWQQPDTVNDIYATIIKSYIGWEYPCMEIFPGTGTLLDHALGAEPLYIVDWEKYMLDKVSEKFNQYYATKRLMKYTIEEYDLSRLPQNSFGFVYAVNWMRFENLQGLSILARSVYDCLMPGGSYLFSYNPLDQWWAVDTLERGYAYGAYTDQLTQELNNIGFELIEGRKTSPEISYMLVKKPGQIEYMKNSSVLGKFIDKNEGA
jgi:hypothetical protein